MFPWKITLVSRSNLRDPFHSTLYTCRDTMVPEITSTIFSNIIGQRKNYNVKHMTHS